MDLAALPRELLAWVAGVALALLILQTACLALQRALRRRRRVLRFERAARGESRAARMLQARGYDVLGAQVAAEHAVIVDREEVVVPLRADYLVEKRGVRYVVEVKTGEHAPRIETRATRRQILEYRVAFDVDGVLLVDGDSGTIREVTFPALARLRPAPLRMWPALVALALAGAAVALARLR